MQVAARWAKRLGIALVAYLVVGNLAILGTSVALQVFGPDGERPAGVAGIDHLRVIDDHVWRGGAPSDEGYRNLAERGITTIVDLRGGSRAEERDAVRAKGFEVVHLPIGDGEPPTAELVDQLMTVIDASPGRVFIHCQAGVGRTGTVAATYKVWMGEASPGEALRDNLAIGPPTLEQIAYTLGLDAGDAGAPALPIVAASKLLDAPRQLWNHVFG